MNKRILIIFGIFCVVFIFTFIPLVSSAAIQPPRPIFPGVVEGEETHFEITNSAYLNIVLDSSEPIKLRMESVPEMIAMFFETSLSANSSQAQITISGFLPLTTYYKFEDNYHNFIQFITDGDGKYAYIQDLSKRHFVFIQPRKSTKFIRDDSTGGDCASIGIWDWPAKTCALTTDLNESIQIDNNGITLDGNGHTITGSNTGMGIYLYQKLGITVKNLNIKSFSEGIRFYYSSGNTLSKNSVFNNKFDGISFYYSDNNIIADNTLISNGSWVDTMYRSGSGVFLYVSSGNVLRDNTISNNVVDGIILFWNSDNNNLTKNKISDNEVGIFASHSRNTTITNNIIENSRMYGIWFEPSNNNIIDGNTINSTVINFGIYLRDSTNNIVRNNATSHNHWAGIYVLDADNNFFTNNNIFDNDIYGIFIVFANNNQFYNNNIIDNSIQAAVYPGSVGNVFNLPLPIGGNYWNNFDIPVEGCSDLNNDNICDDPYVFTGGQDNYPWIKQDGWKLPPNQPPTLSNFNQFKSDKATIIPEEGITTESSFEDPKTGMVAFKATINDPDNDQVKLQIELKEFNQPFNDQDLLESYFTASGNEVVITRTALFERQYHWRTRAVDVQGNISFWQEFGIPGSMDFEVKLVPLYTQTLSPYPSWAETDEWYSLKYADGKGKDSCGLSIADCGCAITSEIMIMRFYGITTDVAGNNVDPISYNDWLAANNGYYPNGDVKWPKIMDYTKNQFDVPRLTYSGPVNSEDTNILDSQLYNLQPSILNTKVLNRQGKLVNHFIVADGKLSTTYTVKDPIYYLTRNLNQPRSSYIYDYSNHFVGLRLFSPVSILPDSISAHLASPGELLFTDPLGRRLGKDPIINIEYNEIPNGVYYRESIGNPESDITPEESKNIWIPEPLDGRYNIQIIGTETGSYTLDTLIYDQTGQSKDTTQEGNTLVNNIQNFELDYSTTTIQQSEIYRIIDIDIKPGSYPNAINLKSKGLTPVAVLTTPFFDAKNVAIDSVIFAGANPLKGKLEDVDNDKDLDLILHFNTQSFQLTPTDTEAILTAKLKDNTLIKGVDSVKIIQEQNKRTAVSKFFSFVGQFIKNLISAIGSITN